LHTPGVEQKARADEKRVGPLARKRCESRIDLATAAGVEHLNLQPHGASGRFHLLQRCRSRGNGRVDERGHIHRSRHQRAQQFQPFRRQFSREKIDAS
jgi:hypothetical protein